MIWQEPELSLRDDSVTIVIWQEPELTLCDIIGCMVQFLLVISLECKMNACRGSYVHDVINWIGRALDLKGLFLCG